MSNRRTTNETFWQLHPKLLILSLALTFVTPTPAGAIDDKLSNGSYAGSSSSSSLAGVPLGAKEPGGATYEATASEDGEEPWLSSQTAASASEARVLGSPVRGSPELGPWRGAVPGGREPEGPAVVLPKAGGTDCPAACQCNKPGTSVNCVGKRLTDIPSGIPSQVQVLYLDKNNFGILKTGALQNLKSLETVYLRNSRIQSISTGAFRDLPALKELYLTANVLDTLQPDAFQNVTSLNFLSLGANRLTSVPNLGTLTGLGSLVLEANRIKDATFPDGYADLHVLGSVVLSNNNLTGLTNQTFVALRGANLRKLEISRCKISKVEPGAFAPLADLQSLKIGYNPIDEQQLENVLRGLGEDTNLVSLDIRQIDLKGVLPTGVFTILAKTSVSTLIFKNNQIGQIPSRAFANLPKLTTLDLESCKLLTIDDQAFTDLPALQRLALSYNLLTAVPQNLPNSLDILYLQSNSIPSLKSGDFKNLTKLQQLILSDNKIVEVSGDSFLGLGNLAQLHLQNNQISYIPKTLFAYTPKLRQLILKNNNFKSFKTNPGAFSSLRSLQTLDLSQNGCSYIPFNYFQDLVSLETLNLDLNRLAGLMAGDTGGQLLSTLTNLKKLSLAFNGIELIHDAQFRNLNKLENLNLKNNRLSSWGPELFRVPATLTGTLQTVDLSANQIAMLHEESLRDLQHIKTLNLSLNPFACTCDLRWFRTWLNNTTVDVANKTTYRCNSPPEWENKLLWTFGPDKIDCVDRTWYYVGAAIGGTFILALIVSFVIYRKRWFIYLRLYRCRKAMRRCCCGGKPARRGGYEPIPGEDTAGRPRYCFYIIAASEDYPWVEDKLLPHLDCGTRLDSSGQRYGGRYPLYYEPRDADPRRSEVANFDENMPACDKALVVLSASLCKDAWCHFLIENAYEMKSKGHLLGVNIIMMENVPIGKIPRILHRDVENNRFVTSMEIIEHALGLDPDAPGQGREDSLARDQDQQRTAHGVN